MKYIIYTDGSCNNSKKIKNHEGGWAFTIDNNKDLYYEHLGFEDDATSSRMELEAVYQALLYVNENITNGEIFIHSDSAYVVNCFLEKWYIRWMDEQWFGVKNVDKWKAIFKVIDRNNNKVKFVKVKGHSGIEGNMRVDFLAGVARKTLIENKCQLKT